MRNYDVVVIGGGPAGASAAKKLAEADRSVLVLDRESFPRTKLCAGWITPDVVKALELDVEKYPYRFNTFENIVVHVKGLTFKLNNPQHSIRRYEFDNFLLDNCGADVERHNARSIEKSNGHYIIDDQFKAKYLIGAGGTRCPVYRAFFRDVNPRARELQAATYEHEFCVRVGRPKMPSLVF